MSILFYKTLKCKLQFTNPVNPNLQENYMFRKFSTFPVKSAQNKKLPQNCYANDLRKTSRSRDREHQFQQNFLGVK